MLCSALYAGGCGVWVLFARGTGGAGEMCFVLLCMLETRGRQARFAGSSGGAGVGGR